MLAAVVMAVVLLAVAVGLARHAGDAGRSSGPMPLPSGTTTVEHDGITVDVPSSWLHLDDDGCEFAVDRWGPSGQDPCNPEVAVAFYISATFDPASGPGLQRAEGGLGAAPAWAGYTEAGEYAVYVTAPERTVARAVLDSARTAG